MHDDIKATLVAAIQVELRKGVQIKGVAARAGVNTQTVSRLLYGETKHPRLDTVCKIAVACDLVVRIESRRSNDLSAAPLRSVK